MTEASRIVDELNRALDGEPWHGPSLARLLDGLTADVASARVASHTHSIWELVRHMTAWTQEVEHRLEGHPAGDPEIGDWPAASGSDAASWERDVQALFDAHKTLRSAIVRFTDAALLELTNDPSERETGAGVSRYVLLHGLAQHHAYHGGQVALLRKAITKSSY